MAINPNLPVVFQQTGDVSRVQDVMQRQGEVQQQMVAQEARLEQLREKAQVQHTDNSDAKNKVDPDGGREERRQRQGRPKAGPGHSSNQEQAPAAARQGKGLFDVVV